MVYLTLFGWLVIFLAATVIFGKFTESSIVRFGGALIVSVFAFLFLIWIIYGNSNSKEVPTKSETDLELIQRVNKQVIEENQHKNPDYATTKSKSKKMANHESCRPESKAKSSWFVKKINDTHRPSRKGGWRWTRYEFTNPSLSRNERDSSSIPIRMNVNEKGYASTPYINDANVLLNYLSLPTVEKLYAERPHVFGFGDENEPYSYEHVRIVELLRW